MTWPPISRDDLRAAATSAGFDMTLPVLVRRLIAETAAGLKELDMPGESGVAVGGFDGVSRTSGDTAFVPGGVSVWELSVGGNDAKADGDYTKRTKAPSGERLRDCTYVQVILAPWTKSRTWATAKTRLRRWREVRGYNLDRVMIWLESAPATTAWLAGKLGKAMPGVRALQEWWTETWIPSTNPPLGSDIVLAGRGDSAKALVDRLVGGSQLTSIGGGLRLDEAMALIAASLATSPDPVAETLLARTLVVSDPNSLERLVNQASPLVIVLSEIGLARNLPARHPHQLVILAPPGDSTALQIDRPSSETVTASLSGQPNALELGYLARRSLLALRRRLAVTPGVLTPTWANSPDPSVRRLSMIGSWRSQQPADRTIVEAIVGEDYAHVLAKAETLRGGEDFPLFDFVQDEWYVVAREDTWSLMAVSLNANDLGALEAGALQVFLTRDPVLEIEPENRWKASMNGIFRPHSTSLRRGLAEYVALAGAGDSVVSGTSNRHSDFARILARKVFDAANADSTYQLWASLTDVVSLLAEGAPDEFISAVRSGLSGGDPLHRQMFQDSTDDRGLFGPSSPHSSFLFALEALAWSPDLVEDIVRLLVALDAIDPGGRLANRPRASLLGVLSVWRPQTTATVEQRVRCLDIVIEQSNHSLEILLGLVPDGHGFQMSHPGPRFRDWRADAPITRADMRLVLDHISEALISKFEATLEYVLAIVPRLDDFKPAFRSAFVTKVDDAAAGWSAEASASVYETLRDFVARHLEHADSAWALAPDQLAPLELLRDRLQPADPSLNYRWLFKQAWVTLGNLARRDDFEAYEKELVEQRRVAMEAIFELHGLDGVISFAEDSDPWIVGLALGSTSAAVERDLLERLPNASAAGSSVAAGFFAARLRQPGATIDALLADFAVPETQAFLLRYLPNQEEAQERLVALDRAVSEIYWRNFNYYGLGRNFEKAKEAGWHLLDEGRPVAALMMNMLRLHSQPADEETADLFAAALESLLDRSEPDPETQNLHHYELEQIFDVLASHRDHLTHERVARLEWQLLPLSSLDGRAPTLHAQIQRNPDFFVELIVACYRASSEVPATEPDSAVSVLAPEELGEASEELDEATSDIDEQQRSIAGRAWEVLHSADQVPGVGDDGQLDVAELESWITESRTQLAEADRVEIGDLQIGQLLSHSPLNEDGSHLPHELRDILERIASDEIMRGINTAILNSRGVTSRDLTDGGRQEWQLAETFRAHAEAARMWPLTRRLFDSIADRYESDARREDLSAERRRQGLR